MLLDVIVISPDYSRRIAIYDKVLRVLKVLKVLKVLRMRLYPCSSFRPMGLVLDDTIR